jgi:hypothetical protein
MLVMREASATHQLLNPEHSVFKTLAGFGGLNSAIGARHAMMPGLSYALPDSVCPVTQRQLKDFALSGEIHVSQQH